MFSVAALVTVLSKAYAADVPRSLHPARLAEPTDESDQFSFGDR
jgi:hypothetical protein